MIIDKKMATQCQKNSFLQHSGVFQNPKTKWRSMMRDEPNENMKAVIHTRFEL